MEVRHGFWAHAEGEYRAALAAADSILADLDRVGRGAPKR